MIFDLFQVSPGSSSTFLMKVFWHQSPTEQEEEEEEDWFRANEMELYFPRNPKTKKQKQNNIKKTYTKNKQTNKQNRISILMAKTGKRGEETFSWKSCLCSWGFCRWSSFLLLLQWLWPSMMTAHIILRHKAPFCSLLYPVVLLSYCYYDLQQHCFWNHDTKKKKKNHPGHQPRTVWLYKIFNAEQNSPVNREEKQYIHWYQTVTDAFNVLAVDVMINR